jgi:hypothetical protein
VDVLLVEENCQALQRVAFGLGGEDFLHSYSDCQITVGS